MNALSIILLLTETAKLANGLSEAVQKGEMTPEEAVESWKKSVANWNRSVDMWRATPAPASEPSSEG